MHQPVGFGLDDFAQLGNAGSICASGFDKFANRIFLQ
jgi:hypothetical protein